MALCRFNGNGSIDIGFGENGGLITGYKNKETSIQSIYIQPDNKILATGFGLKSIGPSGYMILSRYKNDGTLDEGFGENGIQATYLDSLASGENVQLL